MYTRVHTWRSRVTTYLHESCIGLVKLGTRLYDYRPRARELGLVLCECGKSSMALGNRSDGRREGEEKFVSWKQRRRV